MILRLFAGAGLILLAWVVLFLLFAGVGLLLARRLGLRELDPESLHLSFWFGIGLTTLFLQVWNLVFAVDWRAQVVFVVVAAAGLASWRSDLARLARRASTRPGFAVMAAILIVGAWLANRATWFCCSYDSGMYDLPSINWIKAYPVVPGLANLNGRLAFDNASYLFSALLDTGPISGFGSHLANGLLMFVFLGSAAAAALQLLRRAPEDGSRPAADADTADSVAVMRLVLGTPAVLLALRPQLQSFNSNLAGALIFFVAALQTYRFLCMRRPDGTEAWSFVVTALLLATTVAFKLNVAVFAVLATIAVAIHGLRIIGPDRVPSRGRSLTWAIVLCLVMGVAWLARNVILSGYLLYPNPVIALNVPWRSPLEHAHALNDWIRHEGRVGTVQDFAASQGFGWVAPWLRSVLPNPSLLLVAEPDGPWSVGVPGLIAVLAFFAAFRTGRGSNDAGRRINVFFVTALLAGISFWFLAAPQPRLGLSMFWVLAATGVAALSGALRRAGRTDVGRRIVLAMLLLVASPVLLGVANMRLVDHQSLASVVTRYLVRLPPPNGLFHETEESELRTYTTDSGLTVWVPVGDDLRCLDAPLPCTPFPAPNVRLRKPPDLRYGFETVGEWQVERWPYPWGSYLPSWKRMQRR